MVYLDISFQITGVWTGKIHGVWPSTKIWAGPNFPMHKKTWKHVNDATIADLYSQTHTRINALWIFNPYLPKSRDMEWYELFNNATRLSTTVSSFHLCIFPECVAKGYRFTLGVCVCSTTLLQLQPSATVGERSRWGHYGRAYGEPCKSGSCSRFETSRSFVSRGRRGTLSHSNICFIIS